MASRTEKHDQARRHLRNCDPVMKTIIDEVGPVTLRLERDRFWMLVRSIISQQISVGAARSIRNRVEQLAEPSRVTPDVLLALDIAQLRSAGLSPQKAGYVHDLAAKVSSGVVQLRTIGRHTDESVVEQLTQVKGIGRWTAQMFLIFSLGRLDVLPADDLGVRAAIRDRYELEDLPDKATITEIARHWRPYASVASWYCWRSSEVAKNQRPSAKGYPA